jgi:hypothetical protein
MAQPISTLIWALGAARESGDANLGARAANAIARQLFSDGHVTESLSVLETAHETLRDLSDESAALLLTSKAWVFAHIGNYDPMTRSLGKARALLLDNYEPRLFGLAEIEGVSGACYEMLALRTGAASAKYAEQAEQHILRALDAREPTYARSRVLDLVGLANVRLLKCEPEKAIESGTLALEGATKLRSSRTAGRVHAFAVDALDSFPGLSLVSDFAESVRCRLPVS